MNMHNTVRSDRIATGSGPAQAIAGIFAQELQLASVAIDDNLDRKSVV